MVNATVEGGFYLMGFSQVQGILIIHAMLFLGIYLAALMGNLLIITVTTLDHQLHTPMYFFLRNLSFIDLCLISVTIPRSIVNSLAGNTSISYLACVFQVFFFLFFAFSEFVALTLMSYDRYMAICCPLHYETTINDRVCAQMVVASWLSGGLFGMVHTTCTFSLTFCGPKLVHQFFCDVPPLLSISCVGAHDSEEVVIGISVCLGAICFLSITVSYIRIFSTVLKIPSTEGRSKAFSTCLPHLVVVTLFLSTGTSAYVKPTSDIPSVLDLLLSVLYSVVPSVLNPIIYSLRNKEIRMAMRKMMMT
ncbi:olfactory receptor 14A16-like [Ornithorhynchus anatinus]|uniref:olfactory receptor 14A16-like n=1 Tax=Ornithorhynchus anatinus TaxID=9258 RepID=UPI0010A782C7|nr:olfactory receptor 14A16-like [Ornithorhynchus anatinus]